MKTVILLSGGMDSVTLLHKLVAEKKEIKAISFNYGQLHSKELEMAKWQCKLLEIEHKIIDVTFLKDLLPSALTGAKKVPHGHYEDETMKQTVVPFRNTILSAIALGYASGLNFDEVALGVHSGDHVIYPDCRPEFISALQKVARLGDYNLIEIYTPYIYQSKVEIIAEGTKLGVNYNKTWTSYSSGDQPDYKTGSSVERTQAFMANNLQDPLYTDKLWEEAKEYANKVKKNNIFLKGNENIHKLMLADRYRKEQDFIRGEAIKKCKEKNLVVETNAGVGNLTKLYYKANFKKAITNDINSESIAEYNMDSLDFIREVVNNCPDKIDLIDFDFYGCPTEAVKGYFLRIKNDIPVVICISDGLGLWMKMKRDLEKIKEKFLLDDNFQLDERHPWRQHIELWNNLFTKLCKQNNLKFESIQVMQTKGKNYVLGSYLITK